MLVTDAAGQTIHFSPNSVHMITGPKDGETDVVFYVHGVSQPALRLAGTIEPFLATMPNGSNFTPLTAWRTGSSFYVNSHAVRAITPVPADEVTAHPSANALIGLVQKNRYVRETVEQVHAAISSAGGSL